jgi:hypothetical protein
MRQRRGQGHGPVPVLRDDGARGDLLRPDQRRFLRQHWRGQLLRRQDANLRRWPLLHEDDVRQPKQELWEPFGWLRRHARLRPLLRRLPGLRGRQHLRLQLHRPQVCHNGRCCTPLSVCKGDDGAPLCGTVDDGCGGTVDCGPCCTPATKCTDGQCGTVDDGCGGTLACGRCSGPCQTCQHGVCGAAPDGTACDDGDACTTDDVCTNGVCDGTPLACTAPPVCQMAPGTCDAATGACGYAAQANGTTCGTGDVCCNGVCCDGCCGADGACGPCLVFVTSGFYRIDQFGGLDNADAICQGSAEDAGLPGSYRAWLSSKREGSPATRFRRSAKPYTRVDGVIVASDWDDLTDGTLTNPILLTEQGGQNIGFGERVWTATGTDGEYYEDPVLGEHDCHSWQDATGFWAYVGSATVTNATWTQQSGDPVWGCLSFGALFCFQQQ